jgi:hypothetical protein
MHLASFLCHKKEEASMDARRTRPCCRTRSAQLQQGNRGARQICLSLTREEFRAVWHDPAAVRAIVDAQFQKFPELFPAEMKEGYHLTGHLPLSVRMPDIRLRQMRLRSGKKYTLRPSFVMPYMTGYTDKVQFGLRLLLHGVPAWLVAEGCGRDAYYWDRLLAALGRNSLAGTTVRDPKCLPEHLAADEHQTSWCGKKAYITMTAGAGCVLGVDLTHTVHEDAALVEAYGTFAQEACQIDPRYSPKTVNVDGWGFTQRAWQSLFQTVTLIRCFLHGFLRIRERCNKERAWHERVWDVYRAATSADFYAQMKAFRRWMGTVTLPSAVREAMTKFWKQSDEYAQAYKHPGCCRTSNLVDRLMNRMYRVLYSHRGLHGHHLSSLQRLRAWALLQNFCPFAPRAGKSRAYSSPAHRLNRHRYSDKWLENLMLSASLRGRT